MKILGRGWQYTTYDLGNSRVLKKYNSRLVAYFIMFRECFPYIKYPIWEFPAYYKRCKQEAAQSMQSLLGVVKLEQWMLGNPKVLNALNYEQDKMTPLHKKLINISQSEAEIIIDDFIELNKILIKNSVIDRNFNITNNFGVDNSGRIVLMDLGEICTDERKIKNYLKERPWSSPHVGYHLDKNIRDSFVSKMDNNFKTLT